MAVVLDSSRRTNHFKCFYWHRDTSVKDLSEYANKKRPDGFVYCSEIVSKSNDRNKIADAFMFDQSVTTLQTNDINDIKANDLIQFNGDIWRVLNTQTRKVSKTSQFMRQARVTTYIQIKK